MTVVKVPKILGRLLCLVGFHDFRVIERRGSFGSGGVEKVECQRCGLTMMRQG
jgi:hypothetical protein